MSKIKLFELLSKMPIKRPNKNHLWDVDVWLGKKLLPEYPHYESLYTWFYYKYWHPMVIMKLCHLRREEHMKKMKDPNYYYWNVVVPKFLKEHGMPYMKNAIFISSEEGLMKSGGCKTFLDYKPSSPPWTYHNHA